MPPVFIPLSCVIEIGGIPLGLNTTDKIFFDLLKRRYGGFVSCSQPAFELDFDLIDASAFPESDVSVTKNSDSWVIARGDFHVTCNMVTRRGRVCQTASPYSLDAVLRILHSLILAEREGFLLHAASAICGDRAFLFSGISGAGKTTLTRLAPPSTTLLTDEISYVRRIRGSYMAWGTPFAGELAQPGENVSAPISALFVLEKGPCNQILDISPAEAMHRLMRNILFFADDPALTGQILNTACDFVSRIPIRRLMFYPDSRVWDCIRQFEGDPVHV